MSKVVDASADFGSLFVEALLQGWRQSFCFQDGMGEGLLWDAEAGTELLRLLRVGAHCRYAARVFVQPPAGFADANLQDRIHQLPLLRPNLVQPARDNSEDSRANRASSRCTSSLKGTLVHLCAPGVRIAVMGCIVNGPGEMADADFGYAGSRS